MSKHQAAWQKDGFSLRPFAKGEGEKYYLDCFSHPDPEADRLTGSAASFPRQAVIDHYERAVEDPDRYDFVLVAPDGTFAQTPASKDSYETSNLGEQIEKADYKLGEDGGVILFISQHKDQNLHVTYTGDRTYGTTLSRADRQAAADVYQLSQLLTSITQLKKNKEEAQRKIRFVQENIKKRKTVEEE